MKHLTHSPACFISCILAAAALGQRSQAQTIYNLSADFSTSSNPNGPWSYDKGNSPIGTSFVASGPPFPVSGWLGWGAHVSMDASISKVITVSGGWHDLQIGDVLIHTASQPYLPGPMSIAWTSPGAGTISIDGKAWDGHFFDGRDAAWELRLNDSVMAGRVGIRSLFRSDAGASFANNVFAGATLAVIPVVPGDVLRFSTATTTFYGHFMGVEMTVTYQPVPEVGSSVVVGACLAGYGWARQRLFRARRRAVAADGVEA